MPAPWTRAAMLVRTNSLMRGHSGIRWSLVQKMAECIQKGIIPVVPLRGTISASGGKYSIKLISTFVDTCIDLSPLSYVAGMLIGNPAIRAWVLPRPSPLPSLSPAYLPSTSLSEPLSTCPSIVTNSSNLAYLNSSLTDISRSTSGTTSPVFSSRSGSPILSSTPASSILDEEECIEPFSLNAAYEPASRHAHTTFLTTADAIPASHALRATGTTPLPLASKEHLGVVNGTAFSAGLAALVVRNAETMVILSTVWFSYLFQRSLTPTYHDRS